MPLFKLNAIAASGLASAYLISIPVWMTWDPGIQIYSTSSGQTSIDVDPADYNVAGQNPSATVRYVNVATGNDSTLDGTSPTVDGGGVGPYKSVLKAIEDAKAVDGVETDFIIYVAAGTYDRTAFWTSAGLMPLDINLSIIATGGPVYLSKQFEAQTWSLLSGSIYQASRSSIAAVWDSLVTDVNGHWSKLALVGTASTDITGPGQYAYDETTIWVWLSDGRAPDSDVRLMLTGSGAYLAENYNGAFYSEGIYYIGGDTAMSVKTNSSVTSKQYFNGGGFAYSTSSNGLTVFGTDGCYSFGVEAFRNHRDGLNYNQSADASKEGHAFEFDVTSAYNGLSGDSNNNSSTMHDGGYVVRAGGNYSNSQGPVIPDVGGSLSWGVGVTCGPSDSPLAGSKYGYQIAGSGGKLQLNYCRSVDNDTDIVVQTSMGAELIVNNWLGVNTPPVVSEN